MCRYRTGIKHVVIWVWQIIVYFLHINQTGLIQHTRKLRIDVYKGISKL